MNRINAAEREKVAAEFEVKQGIVVAKARAKQKASVCKDKVLLISDVKLHAAWKEVMF